MDGTLDTKAAAALTGLAVGTLNNLRVQGGGPPFLRLGRAIRYRRASVEAWLAEREVRSTSEQVAA